MNSVSFASLAYENKKKKTRQEKFLQEMDKVIPWKGLIQIVDATIINAPSSTKNHDNTRDREMKQT